MTKKLNRRDFLKIGSVATGAGILAACAPQIVTQTVQQTVEVPVTQQVEVTKEVMATQLVEVTKEVIKEVAPADPWLTGLVKPDVAGDFHMLSWEGEGEMRKWLLHIGKFFSKYYPNIKWTLDWGISWGDYWTKVVTQIAGGTPLEMIWMHDTRCPSYSSRGILLPLDDWLAKYPRPGWPDHFYPSQVQSFQYQGKQYGFPYDWAPGLYYINTDMYTKAGLQIPTETTTYDELLAGAQKMSANQTNPKTATWGLGNLGGSGWDAGVYGVVKAFGGEYWDDQGKTAYFDKPETIAAFQYLRDLSYKYNVMPSAATIQGLGLDMETAFASGKIGCHFGLNDISFRINEAIAGKFKWTVAPQGSGPAGRFQFSGGSAFSIPTTSRQKDMAYELITFVLANPDNLPTTAVMGGALVSNMDFAEYGLPPKSTGIQDAFRQAAIVDGKKNPCHPYYHTKFVEWEDTVWSKFQPVWNGEVADVTQTCKDVQAATTAILATL